MSSQYIQEPATSGKVCMHTTAGPIDIELWARECPKACRNFVQLCMEGYYDKTIFHRVVPDFIVQGGDPTGTGHGGESIYGKPFRDELHQRLKFVRRGLVAMANGGPDDNGSQFFFTLDKAPDLEKKHTIFGKVAGNTIYNMLNLANVDEFESEDRPRDPHRIKKTEVLSNPFDDIVPRRSIKDLDDASTSEKRKKATARATKNKSLLSFGDDEDEEMDVFVKKKVKSAHDALDDASLSKELAVDASELVTGSSSALGDSPERKLQLVRERLKAHSPPKDTGKDKRSKKRSKVSEQKRSRSPDSGHQKIENISRSPSPKREKAPQPEPAEELPNSNPARPGGDASDDEGEYELWSDQRKQDTKAIYDVKAEISKLKKQLAAPEKKDEESKKEQREKHPLLKQLEDERDQLKSQAKAIPSKRSVNRQDHTMAMLDKFIQKVHDPAAAIASQPLTAPKTEVGVDVTGPTKSEDPEGEPEDLQDDSWMHHTFKPDVTGDRQARDANIESDDTYSVFDPRHPANKRRRGEFDAAPPKKRLVNY